MSDSEKVYYEMTKEQAKAIREMVERLTQFVSGNYADLLGAKDALMQTVDVLPDTRPERRSYWAKFTGEVEDVEIEIDLNDYMDHYSVNGHTHTESIKENIPDEFLPMVDDYSISVDDASFDTESEVYIRGSYEVMLNEVFVDVPADWQDYGDNVRRAVKAAAFEMHPDLDTLEFEDYGFNDRLGRVESEQDEQDSDTLAAE